MPDGVEEIVFAVREPGPDGHWYANFGYYADADGAQRIARNEGPLLYRHGGRLCKINLKTSELTLLIDDPEGTVRDPVIDYDGKRIVFSYRRANQETFHLYEINIDGSGLRQITFGDFDDIEPTFLPDGDIMFVSARAKRWVACWASPVAVLYRAHRDGSNIRRISANLEQDNTPWVLPDGRILYTRWEYIDRSQVDYHHLWTINPDGTGQMTFFGNLHPSNLYIDAKPIPGTDRILLIQSPGHGRREHAGSPAVLNPKHGPDHQPSLRKIFPDGKDYRDPYPLDDKSFLLARNDELLLVDYEGNTRSLFRLPPEFGEKTWLHEPRPVVSRPLEKQLADRTDLTKDTGQLVLADIYSGRNMAGVERGEIKRLLILESLPKPINYTGGMDPVSYSGTFTLSRVHGTVPVKEDGSAYFELPAKRSFFFVALDEDDNSVKRMQSFVSVMPGEVTGCVGCHEGRHETRANTVSSSLAALSHPPSTPEPIPGIPDVFDFPRDVQPVLDDNCVGCHDYKTRAGGVVLTGDRGPMFSHSYFTLTIRGQFVDGRNRAVSNLPPRSIGAGASPIMKKLSGGHHGVQVTDRERDLIRYWIESSATYPGTYAALGSGMIGGYSENVMTHVDDAWPTAKAFAETVETRCIGCHEEKLQLPLPRSLTDEIGLSFWKPKMDDPRLPFARHLMFNLTRPENSLLLLAPLAKSAGGYGSCSGPVFADRSDPGYQAMLNHVQAGETYLNETLTRFDMPQFIPPEPYFREMKRYGVLPASFEPRRDKFDVYEIDRRYWASNP
jgi:hydrazine synthase alpha subunit-like protein/WD40 repeat protein